MLDLPGATVAAAVVVALPAWAAYAHSRKTAQRVGHPNGHKTVVAMLEDVLVRQGRQEEKLDAHIKEHRPGPLTRD